jgi:hypothetical protein
VVEDLENRNMIQIEQMQQISAECTFEKARIVHQYELNKQTLITQAKYEGYLQGMNQLYQPGPHDTDNNHMNGNLQDFMSTNNESSSARFTAQLQSSLVMRNICFEILILYNFTMLIKHMIDLASSKKDSELWIISLQTNEWN